MEPEEVEKGPAKPRTITLRDVLKGAAIPGLAIAIALMIVGFINFHVSWNYISGTLPGYLAPFASEPILLVVWILAFAAIVYTLVALYYKPYVKVFERIKPDETSDNFFGYIAAFIFFELVISLLASLSGVVPTLGVPDNVAAVAYGLSSVVFTVLMQLVVVYPLLLVFREVRKRNEQFTQTQADAAVLLISFAIDGVFAYFIGISGGFDVTFLLSVIIVNYICIKTGFLRAFLINITINMISVASYLLVSSPIMNTLTAIYLYIWAFLGIFWASGAAFSRFPQRVPGEGPGEPQERPGFHNEHYADLWIRSTCPGCGETKFHVQDDLSLKCEKCGEIIQKDQVGMQNIVVQTRRAYR